MIILDSSPDWQKEVEYIFQDNIALTDKQSDIEPSQIKFAIGEKIKIKDLFAAGLIRSANNAIKTLARQINFCCNQTFIDKMNQKAKELGMINTLFIEPTGLSPKNISTAEDLAKLIQIISEKSEIAKLLSTEIYSFQAQDKNNQIKLYQLKNNNKLLNSFLKIKAAKTGYLDEAGYCFAGILEYNKKKLAVILLGSQSEKDRLQEVKGLAWWAATNFK